ncbi:hypothetical protein [Pseudogemmobacter sonorensis]|uniref:hypothetical protein n=1 Tax=Pseudogemmobacter sonorensis TaxID=2989681 RepID=UPI0036BD548C
MTLHRQTRRALAWGLGAMALGLGLAPLAVALEHATGGALAATAGGLSALAIALGAMLALVGGPVRALQARAFRRGLPSGRLRALALRSGALRWWYWVDPQGRDRDER